METDVRLKECGVTVTLAEPQVLYVAADTEGARKWGVYGVPDMYRTLDGGIVVCANGCMDTHDVEIGKVAESVAFQSDDEGKTFVRIPFVEGMRGNAIFTLNDGSQAQFCEKSPRVDLLEIGVKHGSLVVGGNEHALYGLFRYGDIPAAVRGFEVVHRESPGKPWVVSDGAILFPDLRVARAIKAKSGLSEWPDVKPMFGSLDYALTGLAQGSAVNEALVEAGDGAWVTAILGHSSTDRNARYFAELHCLASLDQGRTWTPRGTIFNQRELSTFGATEEYSFINSGDGIVCVFRTDQCTYDPLNHTMVTLQARSRDNGLTWSTPEPVASSSVTPHLVKLENGVVALVYGRPGVHVKFSTDQCRTWSASTPIIGKTREEELAAGRNLMDAMYFDSVSYSNTRVVKTGVDRFLVLYTDFKHGADKRKAIVVREVQVVPDGVKHPAGSGTL